MLNNKTSDIAEYLQKSILFGILNPESEDFDPIQGAKDILLIIDTDLCPNCNSVLEKQLHGIKCSCGYWECW